VFKDLRELLDRRDRRDPLVPLEQPAQFQDHRVFKDLKE
jgi:hypothetical protein